MERGGPQLRGAVAATRLPLPKRWLVRGFDAKIASSAGSDKNYFARGFSCTRRFEAFVVGSRRRAL